MERKRRGALSNTTTTSATYTAPAPTSSSQTVTITVTSVADTTKTGTATITIPAAPSVTSTSTSLTGAVGTTYSITLQASGGIAPFTWALGAGTTLPACLTLQPSGVITTTSGAAPAAPCAGTYSNLTFTVTDSGTPTPLTATSSALTITIAAAPAITFTGAVPATGTFNTLYTGSAEATGGAGGLAYSVSAGALPTGLRLNAANGAITGTPSVVGPFNFTIQAADAFGDSATQAYKVTIGAAAQTITFGAIAAQTVGTPLTLSATASSGLPVSFASTTTSVCSVAGTTATMLTIGPCTIQATQAGNTNYLAATPVSQEFTVNGEAQTITFGAIAAQNVGTPLTLSATASSGLTVSFASTTTSVCSVAGTTASMLTIGTCTIQATQAGNSTYAAAPSVSQSFTVNGTAQTITFGPIGTQVVGVPLTLSATASSGLTVGFASTTSSVCSVAGTTASMLTAGTCTIQATQAGNSTFAAAAPVSQSFTVNPALSITTPSPLPTGVVGTAYSQTLQAAGGIGPYTWSLISGSSNLAPLGLSFNPTTATVSGSTPVAGGPASFTVQVSDSDGNQIQSTFSVTVNASLAVSISSLPAAYTGSSYTQTLTATGGTGTYTSWTITVNSSGVTALGLSLNSTTGVLSGTAASLKVGNATFTVQVKDSNNNTATQQLTIYVYNPLSLPAPNPTSLPAGFVGLSYTGSVTGSGGSGNISMAVTSGPTPPDSLTVTPSGATVNVSGIPGSNDTVSFTVKLTDNTTLSFISQTYTISITTSTYVLPTANPPAAIDGQTYGDTITAAITGGSGNYAWIINGTQIASNTPTALGATTLSQQFYAVDTGTGVLTLQTASGTTVTGTGNFTFTAAIMDIGLNQTSPAQQYTFTVNPAGSSVSGQIFLQNYCYNGNSNLPVTFTVGLYNGATQVASTTTDVNGNYSFSSVANGTYTITPSLAGAETLFYPPNYSSLTLNTSSNNNVTGENFNASVGFTVSGTVTYSGAQKGQTYIAVNNANCGSATGTSITAATLSAGGAYTVHGVPPGSNTIDVWMDPLGQGVANAIDPAGNVAVTVDANVSNADVTMADPTFTTPTKNPTISTIIPNSQGVVIESSGSKNSNNVEDANQYLVQWSTSATLGGGTGGGQFLNIAGSHVFTANGEKGVWVLNNAVLAGSGYSLTSGATYYFQARSFNTLDTGDPHPTGWCNYTSSGCSGTSGFIENNT